MDGTRVFTDDVQESFLFSTDFLKNVLFIFTVVLLTVFFIQKRKNDLPNFPSGPRGIPILGYIPFLGSTNSHLQLHELGKKYGGIYSLQFGNKKVVVLASFSSIKEAFGNSAILGRPDVGNFILTENHNTGFIDLSGEIWKEQRFFCQKIFQTLGATSVGIENLISEEISHVFDIMKDQNGKPFFIETVLHPSIANYHATLIYGKRLDYTDPLQHRIEKGLISMTTTAKLLSVLNCLPFGKLLRRLSSTWKEGVRDQIFLYNFFRQEVKQQEKILDEYNLQSFLEYYLNEIKKNGEDSTPTLTRDALVGNIWLTLAAGYETVGNTLHWSFLIIAKFPEVQEKVQKEINDVIGRERMPTWNDRYLMPYTRAVLAEIQRWRTVVPTDIFRVPTEDSKLGGFDIPKGTYVLAVLHSAHFDIDHWLEPEKFRPERFLSEDGKTFLVKEAFIPFSHGRRSCPGKIFASIAIFFYFTSFLQKYHIQPADKDIDLEGIAFITMAPKSQELVFRAHGQLTSLML